MKKIVSQIVCLLLVSTVFGQQYSGSLSKVSKSGLHLINVTPNVRSASGGTLNHFRILDSNNNQVPYAVFSGITDVFNLKTCNIIERNVIQGKQTSIVVQNSEGAKLDRLMLKISNSSVAKNYSISGSYDNKEWFGLVYNQVANDLNQDGQTYVDKEFLFPLNNYKYLKFDFNDKNSLPVNVILASYFEESKAEIVPAVNLTDFVYKVETDKKNKITRLHISFETPQVINGVRFDIKAPNMYLREARILVNKTQTIKHQKTSFQEVLSIFQLNSNGNNHFEFTEIFEKEIIIEIENQDNPVLEIKSIELFQRPLQVIADLKKNKPYLAVVDTNYTKPNYDIVNFNLNKQKNLPSVEIENFEKINLNEKENGQGLFWQSPFFLWSSIIVGIILIAYFAFGLLKDLEKKN